MPIRVSSPPDKSLLTVVDADPALAEDGDIIVNSTTDKIKIWYENVWNVIEIVITPGEQATPQTGNPMGLLLAITYP